jgi:hypothetical protein
MKIAETITLENIQDWALAIFCRLIQSQKRRVVPKFPKDQVQRLWADRHQLVLPHT